MHFPTITCWPYTIRIVCILRSYHADFVADAPLSWQTRKSCSMALAQDAMALTTRPGLLARTPWARFSTNS